MAGREALEPDAAALDLLPQYRQRWEKAQYDTKPADRDEAEAGVRKAYARAGLTPPETIIWCRSPMEIERSRKDQWNACRPGASVKSTVVDEPTSNACWAIHLLPAATCAAIAPSFAFRNSAMSGANTSILDSVRRTRWRFTSYMQAVGASWLRLRRPRFPAFALNHWPQHELRDALGLCQYAHDVLGFRSRTAGLDGLWQVALNAGWMVPHERICWLGERWERCNVDASGRPHCENGSALSFRDGWQRYYWKGIEIPSWPIEHKNWITPERIDCERNPLVRRCLIEILTPERYVAAGGPTVVSTDRFGTLWARQWSLSDIWAAVEVINGTPNPDGSVSHYFLQVPGHVRTPLEAVAWTYGISPERYAALMYRT